MVLKPENRVSEINRQLGPCFRAKLTTQPGFGRIIVAFDGSNDSVKAVRMACMLSAKFGSELVVVHVYSAPVIPYSGVAGMPIANYPDLERMAGEGARKTLLMGVRIAEDAGVKTNGELLEAASTVQALVEFSASEKADLLVVGTRGMTGFKKLLLGSVSSGVVSHAACPVLVVR